MLWVMREAEQLETQASDFLGFLNPTGIDQSARAYNACYFIPLGPN